MTVRARPISSPRYGSPAEVAAFLGVSTKKVRRLVDDRPVPAYRVSRRVLVSFREADQFVRGIPTMATAPTTETPVVDPVTGRRRPLSDEELRTRSARLQHTLKSLREITDETDTDENWAEVFRGLAAARPEYPPAEGTS
jgi:excisionase family DNA binding protein